MYVARLSGSGRVMFRVRVMEREREREKEGIITPRIITRNPIERSKIFLKIETVNSRKWENFTRGWYFSRLS